MAKILEKLILTIPSADVERTLLELSYNAGVRMQSGSTSLENCVAVSYKFKDKFFTVPSHSSPRSLFKRKENTCPHRFLHKNNHSIFIHNSN